jgi:hypothetical protein
MMKRAAWSTVVAAVAAIAAIVTARPALAGPASISLTVTGGRAVKFTSSDNTSAALAAGAPLTASVTVTTKNGGGGQIWVASPANPVGTGGATLNLALITVTCVDTGGSGWLNGGSATLVPGGPSAACATLNANVNNKTTTLKVTFTMDARTVIGDVWSATPGFSLAGTAF